MKIITKMKAMKREIDEMNEIYVNIFDSKIGETLTSGNL